MTRKYHQGFYVDDGINLCESSTGRVVAVFNNSEDLHRVLALIASDAAQDKYIKDALAEIRHDYQSQATIQTAELLGLVDDLVIAWVGDSSQERIEARKKLEDAIKKPELNKIEKLMVDFWTPVDGNGIGLKK